MAQVNFLQLSPLPVGSNTGDNVLCVVDRSDTTQSADGSNVYVEVKDLYRTETTPVTVSTPLPDIRQTWNNGAVTFVAQQTDITNTASAAGSLLHAWKVGGVIKASIDITGKGTFGNTAIPVSPTAATPLGVVSGVTNATASGAYAGGMFYAAQSVATSGNLTGMEGIAHASHTSGTVAAVIGAQGVVYVNGVGGTTTLAVGSFAGGSLTAGIVGAFRNYWACAPATGATIDKAYRYYADAVTEGVSENWTFYGVSGGVSFRNTVLADNATVGHLFIPTTTNVPSGVPSPQPSGQVAFLYSQTAHTLAVYDTNAGHWWGVALTAL